MFRVSSYWCTWTYLPVWMHQNFLYSKTVPSTSYTRPFVLDSYAPGFVKGKSFSKTLAVETRWNIINLEIRLKGISTWVDQTRYLKVRLDSLISGRYYFLDAQLREMPRSAISAPRCSNLLSACIPVILKPRCRYILMTCLIPSSMFFFSVFNKNSWSEHNVSGCGVQEYNAIDVHEVIA